MIFLFPKGIFVIISLLNFFLGILIFLKNPKKLINVLFFLISLGTVLWIGGLLLLGITPWNLGGRLSFAGASLCIWFFLWFSFEFPFSDKKIHIGLKIFGNLIALFFFFLSLFSPFIVKKEIVAETTFGVIGEFGPFYPLFGGYFLIFLFIGVFNLFRKLKKIKRGLERRQLEYFLLGSVLTLTIGSFTNLVLPLFAGIWQYSKLGPLGTIFLVGFTALAITRYHLFGIEVILTEILVGVIGLLLIIQIFAAPTVLWRIVNGALFVLFCIFGYLLIRGVYREIRRREEVEKISKAKSEFISITSHQLRTPLTAIKGYLSMVLEGSYGKISEEIKRVMENVYKSNERLIKLVNAFLDISRIELGREELSLERVSIEDLISETISEIEIEAKKKNLYLKFEKPKFVLPKILIDREKIKEVLLNILDNAIKYTQKGGITINCDLQNKNLRISISDTGEGLTKEEIARLFESFSRGEAGTRFWTGGVGLGLYVSRKFVELHKGKIWAESEGKGRGSTFYIELPIK